MEVRFNDFYEEVVGLRLAIKELDAAIDRAECDAAAKCLLEDELSDIRDKYEQLMELDISFAHVDVKAMIRKIQQCIECIDFDISVLI